ncbi:ABC transporter ATP-binding protein [Niallia sp. XMNu-256]|uniref:ABC transporter ATP-binding protein n=1 Tax=Niallia sp. XMNu-256 TaxID=3082444 RepID=UPI0030CD2259
MIVEVQNLSKYSGDFCILKDISFKVETPCVIGLLGKNGAGKSTLMKILTGLSKKSSGIVHVLGVDPWRDWKKVYSHLGVLFEPRIPKYLTNYEYLKEICILRNMDERKIEGTLNLVGLDKSKRKIKDYSFGMCQRLGLAGALIVEPSILILDEPFVGLDPNGIKDLQHSLKELSQKGVLIFISSHQLSELQGLVDRVLFLERGHLKLDCHMDEIPIGKGCRIITSDNAKVVKVLTAKGYDARVIDEYIEIEGIEVDKIVSIVSSLGVSLKHIESIENKLEQLFG